MEGDAAQAFFGHKPIAVVDEVINCFSDYVCDSADAMEATLAEHPELAHKRAEIKQGVDRWQLKIQRSADRNFDKFELYALKNILHVPAGLQQEQSEPQLERDHSLDAELEELWARLQQSLATRRELQLKLASAEKATQLWEANRPAVQKLAESYTADGVQSVMEDAARLSEAQQQSWKLLRGLDMGSDMLSYGENAPNDCPVTPRAVALQRRFAHRKAQTATISVGDLQHLSSMLCAS
ncbi:hypothetical protein AB1Y20_002606 [Prymnesium parvum]|uniref:Protein MIS12 homolog n=1 Tax=Prymnesium parvum TaxID=97485 RepID=A0AB34J8F1_PRYPA